MSTKNKGKVMATDNKNAVKLGFEQTLWATADKLRGHMDAAEYKHVVLGLIFLKYISDAFAEKYDELAGQKDQGADPEDRDEYLAENIFWVPKEARWGYLQGHATQPNIGNLPFNMSDWGGDRLKEDKRWAYGIPSTSNANFAWVQHFIHHLAPNGVAGFVLANGSMSSNSGGEGDIRKAIIDANLVDCMVALPGQLFYSTQIPVCLWFLARNKRNGKGQEGKALRDRSGEILFIDARKLGRMADRTHRELDEVDLQRIANTYHAWRGDGSGGYVDVPGFCKSTALEEVRKHGHVLTPGRYVGAEEVEDDGEPFADKLVRLTQELEGQFAESARLEKAIRQNLHQLNSVQGTAS